MSDSKSTTIERKDSPGSSLPAGSADRSGRSLPPGGGFDGGDVPGGGPSPLQPGRPGGSRLLTSYKQEQGKYTRLGSFLAGGALVAWGAYFVYERLQVYQGDDWVSLLITTGIPILFAVIFGALVWWVAYGSRGVGDFLIATEGEMKKVSWSTRREIIGSTKVVILFTVLMAAYLFVVDVVFQGIFSAIGVLHQ